MTSLSGARVLVVGGSSGIGLGIARRALSAGGVVTIASRSQEKLTAARQEFGAALRTARLDTNDEAGVDSFFAAEQPFDHVVVSSAETPFGPVRELPLADAKRAMESKFWGAYRIARAARFTERGSLTLISGTFSERPSASSVLQGAINAALEGLARGLALELSPIRVNTVSPGLIDTPIWSKMDPAAREAWFAQVADSLPAKTIGQPSDVGNAVLFLMTTPFATGSTIRLDGGGVIA
jgi:NAD(P)-dependent dehydrogenase (short-subunit alcohol dehydrogenase family)